MSIVVLEIVPDLAVADPPTGKEHSCPSSPVTTFEFCDSAAKRTVLLAVPS